MQPSGMIVEKSNEIMGALKVFLAEYIGDYADSLCNNSTSKSKVKRNLY